MIKIMKEIKCLEIVSAVRSNYKGMKAIMSYDKKIYLGKEENCHFRPGNKEISYYDNSDNSLCFISNNHKIFTFLYGAGWVLSQIEMLEHGFTMDIYGEFEKIQNSVLNKFEKVQEMLFKDIPFMGPGQLKQRMLKEERKIA